MKTLILIFRKNKKSPSLKISQRQKRVYMVTATMRFRFEVIMISKQSFRCNKCGKEFVIKGHWYNQMLIEWWQDVRWILHCITRHPKKPNKKDVLYVLKWIIAFIPLLALQILDIVAYPFKYF